MERQDDARVELRDVTQDDLEIFYEHQIDPVSIRLAAFRSRERDAFIAHWKKILSDTSVYKKAILFNGLVAGNIVSFVSSNEREVGYWLGREHWGKGIASKALAQFLGVVKERPLYGHVAKHNIGSRRVLEKSGFRVVGEDKWSLNEQEIVEDYILKLE